MFTVHQYICDAEPIHAQLHVYLFHLGYVSSDAEDLK